MTSVRWLNGWAAIITLLGLTAWLGAEGQNARFHKAPASASQVRNPLSGQAEAVQAGAKLYTHNCGSCHGRSARGTGDVPALSSGATQTAKDGEIFWYITKGDVDNGMPSWAALPTQQRWQIITYLKSLGSTAKGKTDSSVMAPGKSPLTKAAAPR
jgi:mono/diheme cytochrome c family protein